MMTTNNNTDDNPNDILSDRINNLDNQVSKKSLLRLNKVRNQNISGESNLEQLFKSHYNNLSFWTKLKIKYLGLKYKLEVLVNKLIGNY